MQILGSVVGAEASGNGEWVVDDVYKERGGQTARIEPSLQNRRAIRK
jgi:hypothetical protein